MIKKFSEGVYEMSHDHLDKMCRNEWDLPKNWSCLSCWESQDDVTKVVHIPQSIDIFELDAIEANDHIYGGYAREYCKAPQAMMQILHSRGKLEAGIYIISAARQNSE